MESDSFLNKRSNFISQDELDKDFKLDSPQQQYFNRVNTNRQSIVKNGIENNNQISVWPSNHQNSNQSTKSMFTDQIFKVKLNKISSKNPSDNALGIHVIPTYDLDSQKDMGLIIQRIEPNGRVSRDGRMRVGDRIVEINNNSLIGIDFKTAQKILRDAINQSNEPTLNIDLEFKLVRSQSNLHVEQMHDSDNEQDIEINERPIEIELNDFNHRDNNDEEEYENNKENNTINPNLSFNKNHLSSINMSALNTKKMGKIITVQLVKGPQGLGFKLAARDNCANGEFSPIYIKNILPKGAAITDGRLQRGDRLIEVDKLDMTKTTLHEAVNILRNTKLGACVELVVSRQMLPNLNNSQNENGYNSLLVHQNGNALSPTHLPREINDETDNLIIENEINQDTANGSNPVNRRQLLTFEIALNDTGSAGLGVSVKGKTKRIEENDCSIDLGIFIKIVINGGAAFKDGRLRANDQLININGFSLLGKSNEEAMLILREAMQVESKPGHIQLTVSRKVKSNQIVNETSAITVKTKSNDDEFNKRDSSLSPETFRKVEKPVVKVINHSTTSPLKQHLIVNKNTNSTPITTSSGRKDENHSRFSRDAPSRRSMSEKRTKIGAGPINKSQTSNGINNRFNRNTINQSSLIDTYSSQPKRSQTVVGGTNAFPIVSSRATLTNPQEFRTLNKNFKIKTQLNGNYNQNHLRNNELNTIISQESLLSQNNNSKKAVVINADSKTNLECNRIGSFESVLSQTVTVSSNTSNTVKEQEAMPSNNFIKIQPTQQREPKIAVSNHTNSNSAHRRSISMETFQSDQVLGFPNENNQQNHQPVHNQQNFYNKYGTISGFSNKKHSDQNNLAINNNQYTNQTYHSNLNNNELKVMDIGTNNSTNIISNTKNAAATGLHVVNTASNIETNAASSRFRAINRSFRTAVDKSFDMPSNSETSDDGINSKSEQNNQTATGKQKSNANKKSIIETFQNLFKTSNKKNHLNQSNNKNHEITSVNPNNALATTVTNEHFNNKQSNTIELINYQKKNFDDYKNNFTIKQANSCDQIANNLHNNNSNNPNFEIHTNMNTQLETLIDNNTLYTQYKPQSSSSTTNEITFSGNGISSSSSTSSASSTSATLTPFVPKNNVKSSFNVNNRRECLFYHSSDNYRFNNYYQSNHTSRNVYRTFNRIDNNNPTSNLQTIPQEKQSETNMVIKHAMPFNGSKQVHTVSDLFEEDKNLIYNGADSNFDRHNLNQLSTKSQPPINLKNDLRYMHTNTNMDAYKQMHKVSNNYLNNNQHFSNQTKIVLPHPAEV